MKQFKENIEPLLVAFMVALLFHIVLFNNLGKLNAFDRVQPEPEMVAITFKQVALLDEPVEVSEPQPEPVPEKAKKLKPEEPESVPEEEPEPETGIEEKPVVEQKQEPVPEKRVENRDKQPDKAKAALVLEKSEQEFKSEEEKSKLKSESETEPEKEEPVIKNAFKPEVKPEPVLEERTPAEVKTLKQRMMDSSKSPVESGNEKNNNNNVEEDKWEVKQQTEIKTEPRVKSEAEKVPEVKKKPETKKEPVTEPESAEENIQSDLNKLISVPEEPESDEDKPDYEPENELKIVEQEEPVASRTISFPENSVQVENKPVQIRETIEEPGNDHLQKTMNMTKEDQDSTGEKDEPASTTGQTSGQKQKASKDLANKTDISNKPAKKEERKAKRVDLTSNSGTGTGIKLPGVTDFKQPEYPQLLRRREIEGRVVLQILLSTTGEVLTAEVEETSGYQEFDQAAVKAVKSWKFSPARKDDKVVEAWVLVPISFKID